MKFDFKYVTQDEREKLYEEVWTYPIAEVAKKYEVSDTTIRKHLKRLVIPIPNRTYWNKISKGEDVKRDNLPGVTKALSKYVRNYAIKYRVDLDKLSEDELSSQEELHLLRTETKILIKDICSKVKVNNQLRSPHPLILDHKEEIKYRKKRDRELNTSYNKILKPDGYRGNNPTLSINISNSTMNRAYRTLDVLIKTLEELEGYTRVDTINGKDVSYFVIMGTKFLFEIKDKNNILTLSLIAENWMSYSNTVEVKLKYRDSKGSPLEKQVGKIIYEMFVVGNRNYAEYKLEGLIWEKEWEEQEKVRKLEQLRNDELDEVKGLTQAIADWNKATKIRRFTDEFEDKIRLLEDGEQKEKLIHWLRWARDKADWIDPLTEKKDELLGESLSLFDQILAKY